MLVAGLFVMAMFVSLRALSLSGEQVAQRDLGRFGASIGYGSIVLPPGESRFVPDLRGRAAGAGLTDVEVMLSASGMQIATVPARDVSMLETAWQLSPYPDRYQLLSGRWPSQPGEVVVTEPADLAATVGGDLPVLGGKASLRVVGTADDRFARTSNLLVAPGTWTALDANLAEGFPLLGAQPILLWSGNDVLGAVAAFSGAVRDAKPRLPDTASADLGLVEDTQLIRAQLVLQPERTWIARSPAGYTLPSLLLPVAMVLLVFGLNDRRFRRTTDRLVAVGVHRSTATAAMTLATLAWCTAAAAAGALAGTGIGLATRTFIARVRDMPSAPLDGLAAPMLRLLAMVVVTCVCTGIVTALRSRQGKVARRPRSAVKLAWAGKLLSRDTRHIVAVIAWCATVAYGVRVDSPAQAMILTGLITIAVLLSVPDVVDVMLRVFPEHGPRRRLARRQLTGDRRRAAAVIAVLTVLMGASTSSLVLLDTMIRTLDAQAYPEVLPGQVMLADRASITWPAPTPVLRALEASGKADQFPRAELRYLFTTDARGATTRSVTRDNHHGSLLAVATAQDVEQIIGHPLESAQRTTLSNGGLLIWADAPHPPVEGTTIHLTVKEGDKPIGRTPGVPVAVVDVPLVEWRVGTDGIMLSSTAQTLQLPAPPAGPQIISGVTEAQAKAIQEAVASAGLDARMARIHTPPSPPVPAVAIVVTAVGLAFLALAGVLMATRAQTRTLRGYLGRLIAIGVSPTWARHVLLIQYGSIVATSTLLSVVIALPPTVVLAMQVSGFSFAIPWSQLATLLATIYLAVLLAVLRSTLSLRAT
ncbi:hypothetical protein CA850_03955 [Micromonospora echinospora]|nr:hypothetical protein CA850_03955 [Micromonospora echinospora]